MELKSNMYVRTKEGEIGKVIPNGMIEFPKDYAKIEYLVIGGEITKASHNIIDLIEENDYIRIITSAYFEPVYYSYGKLVIRDDIPIENYSNDFIREVITKEQMEAMQYKVVE